MDEQELLELFRQADPETRANIKTELLNVADFPPEPEESDLEPLYTEEEIEEMLERTREFYLDFFFRLYIQDPTLLEKDSPSRISLEKTICRSREELRNKCKENSKNNTPKVDPDQENKYRQQMSLKEFLPKADSVNFNKESLLRMVLLRLINRARDQWVENNSFEQFQGVFRPMHGEILKLLIEVKGTKISRFENDHRNRVSRHLREAHIEIEDNIPFNWKEFADMFYMTPPANAYAIYCVEVDPDIWQKRKDLSGKILNQLTGDHPYIEVTGDTIRLSLKQAAYLKVLFEAPSPMHYLDIWEKATGEKIVNERGAYKEKALPVNVFKSRPMVKKRYIEHSGKAKSGLYKFKK